jgi:hypothetical protein
MSKNQSSDPGDTLRPDSPPKNLSSIQAACRDGDADALLAWASEVEQMNALPAATILRGIPRLKDAMTTQGIDRLDVSSWHTGSGETRWWLGAFETGSSEDGDEFAVLIGQLLAGWNDYHPAIEWLFRQLQQNFIRCEFHTPQGQDSRRLYRLLEGAHLEPLPEGATVRRLWFGQSGPISPVPLDSSRVQFWSPDGIFVVGYRPDQEGNELI